MKKNYFRAALALPAVAFMMYSFTGGNPAGLSGSPGDNGSTCTNCHSGGSFGMQAEITTDIPDTGYQLGQTYNITVKASGSSANKHGFNMVAENANNTKVGTFSDNGGLLGLADSAQRVLHTGTSSSENTWVTEWTAPSSDEGDVTFYAAVNATNSNFSFSGDQVSTASKLAKSAEALGVSEFFASQFAVYPNPASNGSTTLELPAHLNSASVVIYNYLGQAVKNQEVSNTTSSIDLDGLSSGVYYMSIQTAEGSLSKSIVIQ